MTASTSNGGASQACSHNNNHDNIHDSLTTGMEELDFSVAVEEDA
jgi:hypothetical protein